MNTNRVEELAWKGATTFLGIGIGCVFIDEVTAGYVFLSLYCLCMAVYKYCRQLVFNTNEE